MRRFISAGFGLILFPSVGMSAVLRVPSEYATIGAAVGAASAGDEIAIAAGTYTGPGNRDILVNKSLTIRSDDPARPVLDGEETTSARCFLVHLESHESVVLSNLEITRFWNAEWEDGGSGIRALGSGKLILENCRIAFCRSEDLGAGLQLLGQVQVEVSGSEFYWNIAGSSGGGIGVEGSASLTVTGSRFEACSSGIDVKSGRARIVGTLFMGNGGGGGAVTAGHAEELILENCAIVNNAAPNGAGVETFAPTRIEGCTISNNVSSSPGKASGILSWSPHLVITRTILRDNCGFREDYDLVVEAGTVEISCSAVDSSGIRDWDSITFNGPQVWSSAEFCVETECYPDYGDWYRYEIDADSPCSAWRSPCGETIGALDVGCGTETLGACCVGPDCVIAPPDGCETLGGAYLGDGTPCQPNPCQGTPTIDTSWGSIKARFRK